MIRSGSDARDQRVLVREWQSFLTQQPNRITPSGYAGEPVTWTTFWNDPVKKWFMAFDLQQEAEKSASIVHDFLHRGPCAAVRRASEVLAVLTEERARRASGTTDHRHPAFLHGACPPTTADTHFDGYDSLALVIMGGKTFWLLPHPLLARRPALRGFSSERRDVDPARGDRPEPWQRVDLVPGDILFIPAGEWHYVLSSPHTAMTNVWWPAEVTGSTYDASNAGHMFAEGTINERTEGHISQRDRKSVV